MNNGHTELVRLTALFIEKHGSVISKKIPDSEMTYSYNTSGSSNVSYHLKDGSCYIFEILPQGRNIKIQLANTLTTPERSIYRGFLKAAPFVNVDYKRVFKIFDFIKQDDEHLGSIKSFKRFNAIADSYYDFFNANKLVYQILYKDFYKKINRRVKMNASIKTYLSFDAEMNIVIYYTITITSSDRDFIEINFNTLADTYDVVDNSVDGQNMNQEQLFNYISAKRRKEIIKNIERTFKNIDFEIDFDNKFQEQIQLLEMLAI